MPKFDLVFSAPLMNAAGALGYAPNPRGPLELERLGAFVTAPVSLAARSPSQGERCLNYNGGFLLHTGLPNPGLSAVLQRFAPRWKTSPLPVIVHLLASRPDEIAAMLPRLETQEGILGIEVGLPPGADAGEAAEFTRAALGELPVIVRTPLESARGLGEATMSAGAAAVSLGPPRGALPTPGGALVHGRLFGPAIFPQALEVVRSLALQGIPVIGAGGVYSMPDAEAMLAAGALAVQLDSVLWTGRFNA